MIIKYFAPYHICYDELKISLMTSIIFKELIKEYKKEKISNIISKPQYGYTTSAMEENTGIKFVRITDIQSGFIDWDKVPYCLCNSYEKYRLEKNDILFARTGGTTGKSIIINEVSPKSIFASYLIRIKARTGVNPFFINLFFQTNQYWNQIKSEKMGSAQPNVNAQKIQNLILPIPPINIQNQISDFMKDILEKKEEVTSHKYILKIRNEIKKSIAIIEFFKDIDELLNKRKNSIDSSYEYYIDYLISKYQQKELGNLVYMNKNNINPKKDFPNKQFKYVDISCVESRSGIINTHKNILGNIAPTRARRVIKKGDLILSTVRPYLRSFSIIDDNYDNQICSTGFAVLSCKDIIMPNYLLYILFSNNILKQFNDLMVGAHYPALRLSDIKKLKIPLPTIEQQNRIVKKMNQIENNFKKLLKYEEQSKNQIENLKTNILNQFIRN